MNSRTTGSTVSISEKIKVDTEILEQKLKKISYVGGVALACFIAGVIAQSLPIIAVAILCGLVYGLLERVVRREAPFSTAGLATITLRAEVEVRIDLLEKLIREGELRLVAVDGEYAGIPFTPHWEHFDAQVKSRLVELSVLPTSEAEKRLCEYDGRAKAAYEVVKTYATLSLLKIRDVGYEFFPK